VGAEDELVTVASLGASRLDNLTHVYDVRLTEGRSYHLTDTWCRSTIPRYVGTDSLLHASHSMLA